MREKHAVEMTEKEGGKMIGNGAVEMTEKEGVQDDRKWRRRDDRKEGGEMTGNGAVEMTEMISGYPSLRGTCRCYHGVASITAFSFFELQFLTFEVSLRLHSLNATFCHFERM
jgi:hypothetical protein